MCVFSATASTHSKICQLKSLVICCRDRLKVITACSCFCRNKDNNFILERMFYHALYSQRFMATGKFLKLNKYRFFFVEKTGLGKYIYNSIILEVNRAKGSEGERGRKRERRTGRNK